MTTSRTAISVSRRSAFVGLGAGAAGLALATAVGSAAAQDAPPDFSAHPLTGMWLAMANPTLPEDPQFPSPGMFSADGYVVIGMQPVQRGQDGVQFISELIGTWEPDSDRRGHFTAVQSVTDGEGNLLGSTTIDGYPEVSADGQSFIDDGSRVMVTIRDPAGAVVQQILPTGAPSGRPVTAIRMGPGSPGFPAGTPATGTPPA